MHCVGRPASGGLLAEEREVPGLRRALQPEVRGWQDGLLHHQRGQDVRLGQVRAGREEQVWLGDQRLHCQCVHPRGGSQERGRGAPEGQQEGQVTGGRGG